jgi:hypothetical protein
MNMSPLDYDVLLQQHQRDIQRSVRYQGYGDFSTASQSNIVSELVSQAKQWLQARQVRSGNSVVQRAHAH